MKANDLHNFKFEKTSAGQYRVTYKTENRGDYWVAYVNAMWLIDETKNAEWAKLKDIKNLRTIVKYLGVHYNKRGEKICY